MPTALFVSPHLDDVAFSCGGIAALLADAGWQTVLATVFTRSVVPATGFALACQLDKGLPPDADYMAIRRTEDRAAADILQITTVRWLHLLEAPHRGYEAPPELFGALHPRDGVGRQVADKLAALAAEFSPDLVFVPQGLGNHVDHQVVISAAIASFPPARTAFYRDTPYAIRQPGAAPARAVPQGEAEIVPITGALDRKIAAAQAYASQIGFQFGGAAPLAEALRAFAVREGDGVAAERLLGCRVGPLLSAQTRAA